MKINTLAPWGIGFDRVFADFDVAFKENTQVYPPHNVVKIDDDSFLIELAVAGFSIEDLNIETVENSLVITGERTADDEREYTHKGISTRKFTRRFTLAEYVNVGEASLANGILSIALERVIPDEKKPRTISIK
jgi:molecular chaperone IbpA